MSETGAKKLSCCVPGRGATASSRATRKTIKTNGALPDRLVSVPGGASHVGTSKTELPIDGEGPPRKVRLKPYRIDPIAVTYDWFAKFIGDTGYKTDAETYGWSLVFFAFLDNPDQHESPIQTPWWRKVEGATWAQPLGPGSDWESMADHPVTHVSRNDANAFAQWVGGRLPSEAEWEHAARSGAKEQRFPWGEEEPSDAFTPCNIWQGTFPSHNTTRDGYAGTAPAKSFKPNALGLYNMVGNTWEWSADTFRVRSQRKAAATLNKAAITEGVRLLKGGSYLCHASYCYRYRIAARTGVHADTSTGHTGFRIVAD